MQIFCFMVISVATQFQISQFIFLYLYIFKYWKFCTEKLVDSDPNSPSKDQPSFLLVSLSKELLKSFYFYYFVPKFLSHKRRAESVRF